jgi:hypothetical protein
VHRQEVARRAQAFEMTVIAHDLFIAAQAAADWASSWSRWTICVHERTTVTAHAATPQTNNVQRRRRRSAGPAPDQHRARHLIDRRAVAAIESIISAYLMMSTTASRRRNTPKTAKVGLPAHRSIHAKARAGGVETAKRCGLRRLFATR